MSPDRTDGRSKLVSEIQHQRFYDSYEAFWNSGKTQSTALVKSFEQAAFKHEVETSRLE